MTGSASKKKMTSSFSGTSPGWATGCDDLKILDDNWSQSFIGTSAVQTILGGLLLALSTPIRPYLGTGTGAGPE